MKDENARLDIKMTQNRLRDTEVHARAQANQVEFTQLTAMHSALQTEIETLKSDKESFEKNQSE